jgi:hypothetical protein
MKLIPKQTIHISIKVTFFVISALITVLLIPDSTKFRYEFQKGEPWKHESLIAEFDFPVYKGEETLKKEKDSVLKYAKTIFYI